MVSTSAWVSRRVVLQAGQVLVSEDVVSDAVGIVAQDATERPHPPVVTATVKVPTRWDLRIDDRVSDFAVQELHQVLR